MKLLVIDNYDSFTYNLVQYFGQLGASTEVFRNDVISIDDNILYRCRKKYFPMIYPRLANMGWIISEIEALDPTDDYMSVRLTLYFKK